MATELSVSDFRNYFVPIFSDADVYSDSEISRQLEEAEIEVSESIYGKYYRRAAYYLTAHFLSLFNDTKVRAELAAGSSSVSASKGIMTSVSVGDLSKSMEMPEYNLSSDDKFLASTQFGQEFIRLRNKMGRGALIANQAVSYP